MDDAGNRKVSDLSVKTNPYMPDRYNTGGIRHTKLPSNMKRPMNKIIALPCDVTKDAIRSCLMELSEREIRMHGVSRGGIWGGVA